MTSQMETPAGLPCTTSSAIADVEIGSFATQTQLEEDAWNAYVRFAAKATETRRLEDGIQAGKAFGRFMMLFVAEEGEHAR